MNGHTALSSWRLIAVVVGVFGCTSGSGGGAASGTGGEGGGRSAGLGGSGGSGAASGGGAGGAAGGSVDGAAGGRGGAGGGSGGGAGAGSGGASDAAGGSTGNDARSAQAGDGAAISATLGPAGCACPADQAFGNPLPANTVATLVKGGMGATEGPAWVAAQKALYFCDYNGNRVFKYTPADGQMTVFSSMFGTPAGLAVDPRGQLVMAAADMQRLTRVDPATAARTQIPGADSYMGKPFDQTNDVVVRADGNMYFTDTDYFQKGRPAQDSTAYYRLSPAGVVTRIMAAPEPNGISLSPDGKWLYVSIAGGTPAIRRHPVADDGSVGAGAQFFASGSDGMAVDCAGNVYITGGSMVRVIAPGGQAIGAITGFSGNPTNAAFGGDDYKTLYITAGAGLYQIRLNTPGYPN